MSREKWSSIVYGRSYHLDFRFIALPEDFGESEVNWALPHILATTQRPKKLSSSPRWSLFKNQSHCVVGVTCMVRDLLGNKESDLTRDDKDRPLYIFVGYAAKLTSRKYLTDLPPYNNESLADFENLYDYVRQVWLVKDFYKNSHQCIKTSYKARKFAPEYLQQNLSRDLIVKLNCHGKNSDQVYLWQDRPKRNSQLWATSAVCSQATSICLGNKDLKQYVDNPFLNQTIESQNVLTIKDRLVSHKYQESQTTGTEQTISFTEILSNKVKQDIQVTYNSALQIQQLMMNNLDNDQEPQSSESSLVLFDEGVYQDFGFKTKATHSKRKISESTIVKNDWF